MIVLHHLASSGGTLLVKALAAQRDCVFVNEVHPYFSVIPEAGFSPSTPLQQYLARYGKELPDAEMDKVGEELFQFQIQSLQRLAGNKTLILREWSHGDFFETDRFSSSVLPLLEFAEPRSVVLIRHPIDCYLSGKTYNAWHMIASDINEFCRRYCLFCRFFMERPGIFVIRYEDFVADSDKAMRDLCGKLNLAFQSGLPEGVEENIACPAHQAAPLMTRSRPGRAAP